MHKPFKLSTHVSLTHPINTCLTNNLSSIYPPITRYGWIHAQAIQADNSHGNHRRHQQSTEKGKQQQQQQQQRQQQQQQQQQQ